MFVQFAVKLVMLVVLRVLSSLIPTTVGAKTIAYVDYISVDDTVLSSMLLSVD